MDLAKHVKDGCKDEDLVGLIFNTIGVRYFEFHVF
jgi:dihydroxy-acid dehydratase